MKWCQKPANKWAKTVIVSSVLHIIVCQRAAPTALFHQYLNTRNTTCLGLSKGDCSLQWSAPYYGSVYQAIPPLLQKSVAPPALKMPLPS